jgi:hypothetical protein
LIIEVCWINAGFLEKRGELGPEDVLGREGGERKPGNPGRITAQENSMHNKLQCMATNGPVWLGGKFERGF